MPSPIAVSIELTAGEREQLKSWSGRRTTAQALALALALRSRIVLAAAEGLSSSQIGRDLGVSVATVRKWRNRFSRDRLDGLVDEPRPGRPRTITDAKVDEVIVKTLESTPRDATHWSTRAMAREVGSRRRRCMTSGRRLGSSRTCRRSGSSDPQFVAKVRDIVGLYLHPPERAVVLAVDEKSQIQALDRTRPILPMLPGTPERATHDYKRHGTSSLYAALDLATGKLIGRLHSHHRAVEFKKFLQTLDREVPADLEVHLSPATSALTEIDRGRRRAPSSTATPQLRRRRWVLVSLTTISGRSGPCRRPSHLGTINGRVAASGVHRGIGGGRLTALTERVPLSGRAQGPHRR
jgi:transposase